MQLKLIDNWRTVLLKAWSSRLMVVSAVLWLATTTLPFWVMLPDEVRDVLPSWVFTWVPLVSMILAVLARVVEQPKLRRKLARKQTADELKARREKARLRRQAAVRRLLEEDLKRPLTDAEFETFTKGNGNG